MENDSRKPRDLSKNRHIDSLKKGQLTLSGYDEKEREDDVTLDDDVDAVRTSVSQNRVTAALCTEELFLSTHYIQLFSTYQTGKGRKWNTQIDASWIHLAIHVIQQGLQSIQIFIQLFCRGCLRKIFDSVMSYM